ncbi:acyl-CoA dehydrogenase family protein [Pseudarthrobacter phenanthrenivorans]|uniref:acyl-CoA dehydrogenase family protein n=1 Tax=Pseudarthrobacter phenanthrenivorans TaxID=361575 RepID=UPI00344B2B65
MNAERSGHRTRSCPQCTWPGSGWSKSRQASGRANGGFQGLQHLLVDAALNVEASGLLLEEAVRCVENGHAKAEVQSALATLAASEAAITATHVGMRLMGGWDFAQAMPMQRHFRDVWPPTFPLVTNEMT